MPALKRCPVCKCDLPLDAFHRDSHAGTGRTSVCKACRRLLRDGLVQRPTTTDDVEYVCVVCGITCLRPRKQVNMTRCPSCQNAASRLSTREAGQRRNATTREAKTDAAGVPHCTSRCAHWKKCCSLVYTGQALPCCPNSAIQPVDCAPPVLESNWRVRA
jgi:hypothetical protein